MPYRSHAPQPVEQPPPPTGDPLPAPVRMSPQDRSTQKTLVFLALALTVLAFTIPAAAPLLLSLAGVITWRTTRLTGRAGYWCVGAGLGLMVFGGILGPEIASVLARLTAAGFLAWFGLAAYKRL